MQSDGKQTGKQTAPMAKSDDGSPTAPTRADAYRERFRQAQAIAAQVARARAAGGQPSEAEAARLVAEFHARGGQVTQCPEAEEAPPKEANRRPPSGRSRS